MWKASPFEPTCIYSERKNRSDVPLGLSLPSPCDGMETSRQVVQRYRSSLVIESGV